MYNFVIFDVDGTLIDTEKVVIESYDKVMFEELGRHFTREDVSAAYGVTTPVALANLGFKDIDRALKKYSTYLFEEFGRVEPFKGIVELLETMKTLGVPSGIVTSRNKGEITNDACLQKLMKYFSYTVGSEDTLKHKPDPEPALKLLEKAGLDGSKVIYVGDTYFDYMCAKNAGLKFALASWGARDDDNIKADFVLRQPKDLLALVQNGEI